MSDQETRGYVTPPEAAARLRVARPTIYKWIAEGRIGSVRFGRTVRIPVEELERFEAEARRLPSRNSGDTSYPGGTNARSDEMDPEHRGSLVLAAA